MPLQQINGAFAMNIKSSRGKKPRPAKHPRQCRAWCWARKYQWKWESRTRVELLQTPKKINDCKSQCHERERFKAVFVFLVTACLRLNRTSCMVRIVATSPFALRTSIYLSFRRAFSRVEISCTQLFPSEHYICCFRAEQLFKQYFGLYRFHQIYRHLELRFLNWSWTPLQIRSKVC